MYFLKVIVVYSLTVFISVVFASEPNLDLTLPSTTLLGNQKPLQLFGKPTSQEKTEGLHITHAVSHPKNLTLTLTQAIALALRHNTSIRTTYMSRISDRYQFYLDKRNRKFWYYFQGNPGITISADRNITQASAHYDKSDDASLASPNGTSATNSYSIGPFFGFTSPLGTNITLSGVSRGQLNGNITITQPLLKGFGYGINKIPWEQSKLAEAGKVLSLRTSVSGTILIVIQQYRALISASLNYQNSKQAFKEAEQTLNNSDIQVKAGRMAKSELLASQIGVQTAKNSLLTSANDIKQQQQDFATLLGIKKDVAFKVDDKIALPDITLNEKQLIDYALENKPAYLQKKLSYQHDVLSLKKEENNQLWNLELTASAGRMEESLNRRKTNNYDIKLNLTVPLDTSDKKKTLLAAKIQLENDKLNLQQQKLQLISDIHNKLNALEQNYKALKIKGQQLALQEEQVKNTVLSLKYGKASAYDLAQQQQKLNGNRNSLVTSKIDYLNQLSGLDDYLGTALSTWQVVLAP